MTINKRSKQIMNYYKGFTLAEVLVTLAIIGVIAALTIPALLQSIESAKTRTAYRSAYSDLNQATKHIMEDNGGTLKGYFTGADVNLQGLKMMAEYSKYYNNAKTCTLDGSFSCWHQNNTWYNIVGTPINWSYQTSLILANGMLIAGQVNSADCTELENTMTRCGFIYIDVNGFARPNTISKDIFPVHVTEFGIKPFGIQGDGFESDCNDGSPPSGWGMGCSTKYLLQ